MKSLLKRSKKLAKRYLKKTEHTRADAKTLGQHIDVAATSWLKAHILTIPRTVHAQTPGKHPAPAARKNARQNAQVEFNVAP